MAGDGNGAGTAGAGAGPGTAELSVTVIRSTKKRVSAKHALGMPGCSV